MARFTEDGERFAECPVVLDFGIQVVVCHTKCDELSIGWDTIDTHAAIAGWEWFKFPPQWSSVSSRPGSLWTSASETRGGAQLPGAHGVVQDVRL